MRTTQTVIQCNLCGIDSTSVGEQCFTPRSGYDFCRWCMSGPVQSTECGGHVVTVTGDTWACDCGVTMARLKMTLWRHGVDHSVFAAVPNLTSATAAIHVQTPNWPKPY